MALLFATVFLNTVPVLNVTYPPNTVRLCNVVLVKVADEPYNLKSQFN